MKIFTPFESKKLKLRNRIVMAPMTRSKSPGNTPGDDVCEYYRKRAAGEVGLIITEGLNTTDPSSPGYPDVPVISDKSKSAWEKIVKAVHKEGGKIAPQLWHVGAIRSPGFDSANRVPSLSPSGVYSPPREPKHRPLAMTKEQIEIAIQSFIDAAVMSKEIGFDAIEIHGAHGYLIDQFFWDVTNKRDDQYGGNTLKERMKFATDTIKGIRSKVGEDFPIIFRFSNWKLQTYEKCLFFNPDELQIFLDELKIAGVDIFHGSSRYFDKPEFDHSPLNIAAWSKKLSGLPSISVGSVGLEKDFMTTFVESTSQDKQLSLDSLFSKIENEEFDLIAIGRALLSDPDWVIKVKEKRFDDIIMFDKEHLAQL